MNKDEGSWVTAGPNQYTDRLAYDHGVSPDQVWDHPNNRELKDRRPRRNILAADDRVFVPVAIGKSVSCQTEVRHRFRRRGLPLTIRVRFLRNWKPLANTTVALGGANLSAPIPDSTDSEGMLELRITPPCERIIVGLPAHHLRYEVLVGALEPASTLRGKISRLQALDMFPFPNNAEMDGSAGSEETKRPPDTPSTPRKSLNAALDEMKIDQLFGC